MRPDEVGSTDLIGEAARNDAALDVFELQAQFRSTAPTRSSAGSTTRSGLAETANPVWEGHRGLRLPDRRLGRAARRPDPREGRRGLHRPPGRRLLLALVQPGRRRQPRPRREGRRLVDALERPPRCRPPRAPTSRSPNFWASNPNGINQVGCVYTAQGFEFDYVGVIFGRDLRWDPESEDWIGDPSESHDSIVKRTPRDRFTDLVKRTYRRASPAA